jgi:short-subunit dehydrogenase
MNLTDRVVLVTGASSGIGAATARAFGREGAHVVLLARSETKLANVAAEITADGGKAASYPVDLTDPEVVTEVADAVKSDIGHPTVIVNIAGSGEFLAIEETTPADAHRMMAVPYFAAFHVTRAFIPDLLTQNEGHIVNLTSAAAIAPWPGAVAYATARWAMRGFSEALRADLHDTDVEVTQVVAAEVESPYWEHNSGSRERLPTISKLFPTLTPEDVADAIVQSVLQCRRTVLIPRRFRVVAAVHRLFPRPIEWLVRKTGRRRQTNRSRLEKLR